MLFRLFWAGQETRRLPNLLTAKDLFGENQEIRMRLWLTDLSTCFAERGYMSIGLLTKLCHKVTLRHGP